MQVVFKSKTKFKAANFFNITHDLPSIVLFTKIIISYHQVNFNDIGKI
jgi:hypothetical protein